MVELLWILSCPCPCPVPLSRFPAVALSFSVPLLPFPSLPPFASRSVSRLPSPVFHSFSHSPNGAHDARAARPFGSVPQG